MKVLMFGWEYPPHNSGGLGVACQGIARALSNKGIEVIFVLPKQINVAEDNIKFIFADIPSIMVKAFNSLLTAYTTSKDYHLLRNKINSTLYGASLFEEVERYSLYARQIASENDFDIIHAHDWLSFAAGIAAKEVSSKPLITHFHSTEFDRAGGIINQRVYEKEKEGALYADKAIVVSNLTKNALKNHYSTPDDKIVVVHNGIDTDNYDTSEEADEALAIYKSQGYKIILFVGRITLQKGPDYFLKAASEVLKLNKKVLFVIAGSGDMEGQIMLEASKLNITDNVLFTGFLRGQALSKVYKAADLFVMPSVSEPFGLVALESLAHGTPVLISKQSGVSESLKHALKANFWDIEELADNMLCAIENAPLQNALLSNGQKELVYNNWDNAAEKLINIYNTI